MLLEAWIEIGLSTPPAVPGPGLLEHCPDQLMPLPGTLLMEPHSLTLN